MTNSQSKFPQLRFPEFTDEWKPELLKKVANINPPSKKIPDYFYYIDLGCVKQQKLINTSFVSKNKAPSRAQRLLMHNDILFQMVRPYQKNNLLFKNENEKFVASTGYAQLRAKDINYKFLFQYLHTNSFVNNVIKKCTGSNYPAINSKDLSSIFIKFPELITEQEKIATFLTAIDKRIELLTAQKEQLELYKKGLMQKLFSQEIRFKDENGNSFPDWKEKKLGEVGFFTSGFTFPKKEQGGKKGIPFYKVSDMNSTNNYRTMNIANNYISKTQIILNKYKPLHQKSIIFAKVGAAIYLERKRLANNFLIDNNMMSFTTHEDIIFYKYIFDKLVLSKYTQTGALPSLNKNDLQNISIKRPIIKEQNLISQYLTSTDTIITNIKTTLKLTQFWKKGIINKIFTK